jgi:hypothetical protein
MSITRSTAEAILVKRTGKLMTKAGLDGATENGTNVDLNDPIGWALRKAGYLVVDPTAVADADLAPLSPARLDMLLDLAELRALENILGNLDLVTAEVGRRKEEFNDLAERLADMVKRKRKQIELEHKVTLGELKPASFEVY